jgi:ankyrin repeat protein
MVRLLLDNGADANAANLEKMTVLHYAAELGTQGIVRLLMEKGANSTARALFGRTALHIAAASGNDEVLQALLDGGIDINMVDGLEQTALIGQPSMKTRQLRSF